MMNTLLALTLSGSVLALLLLSLRYVVLRKMPSTVYYYAWLLVLLRFALPLPGLIPATGEMAPPEAPAAHEAVAPDGWEQTPLLFPRDAVPGALPAVPDGAQDAPASGEAPELQAPAPAKRASFSVPWRSPGLWLSIWAFGTALSFGVTVFAYLRFTSRLRHTLHRPDRLARELYAAIPGRKPKLFCSAAIRTPLMFGVFSPKIVLPEREYDEGLLLNILRHELTHYRRFDTLYKWVAVAVLSAHWFNPLSWFVRKELNRACELSCDEMLLRTMTRREKQAYGNTLLSMAANSALPAGVVATTFATEKRNLKERLVQIMNYKKNGARMLATVLALVLLAGCGMAAGPAVEKEEADDDAVRVTNVDELLAAIAPNTVIELAAGEYDLSTASNYGEDTHSSWYSWNGVWSEQGQNQAELVIQNVESLTLRGAGLSETTIAAVPRYANVIRFVGCRNLTVSDLTAGHTREPGFCSGGVFRLENCLDTAITSCGLFGCGTIGVDALECSNLAVTSCRIYECSYNAVSLSHCRDVRMEDCDIDSHGTRPGQGEAMQLFAADYSDGFVIHGCRIHDNATQYLLRASYSKNTVFLTNDVHDNRVVSSMFSCEQYPAVVDGCRFEGNDFHFWVPDHRFDPVDVNGEPLEVAQLNEMTLRDLDPRIAVKPVNVEKAAEVRPGGEIAVTTVDEFLKAIGPDRTVVLEGELFDLSSASSYGSVGGEYYFWNQSYDGPELVIQNVNGLTIRAAADDAKATTLAAIPRYANVLNFSNCENLTLIGFTAGHTKGAGECSGGVLNFQNCGGIRLGGMRLYGCGVLGIQASQCASIDVRRTEIYECSQGAAQFYQCDGLNLVDCDIHDVPSPAFRFTECGDKVWNGEPFTGLDGMYDVDENGNLAAFTFPEQEEPEYHGGVEDLNNPFAAEPAHRFQAGTPQAAFAAFVQQAIAGDDWEALADRIAFPLQFFTSDYSFVIHDREEYLDMARNGYFTNELFTDTFRFRERIAADDLSEFGSCVFGDTCLDHSIAFACFGAQETEENLKITAISVLTPLWPGRSDGGSDAGSQAYVQAVPPTPQP